MDNSVPLKKKHFQIAARIIPENLLLGKAKKILDCLGLSLKSRLIFCWILEFADPTLFPKYSILEKDDDI